MMLRSGELTAEAAKTAAATERCEGKLSCLVATKAPRGFISPVRPPAADQRLAHEPRCRLSVVRRPIHRLLTVRVIE